MILTYYESHGGGVNNLAVALDEESGIRATSTKGKEAAVRNLQRSRKYKAHRWQKLNAMFRSGELGKSIADGLMAGILSVTDEQREKYQKAFMKALEEDESNEN